MRKLAIIFGALIMFLGTSSVAFAEAAGAGAEGAEGGMGAEGTTLGDPDFDGTFAGPLSPPTPTGPYFIYDKETFNF